MHFSSWHKILTSARTVKYGLNIWPPFLFSGIRVTEIAKDFRSVQVKLHSNFFNRNYVGTHFGGSLYAMSDPFFMLMLMRNLSSKYFVWDQEAKIVFVKPGRETVSLEAQITEDDLTEIKEKTQAGEKYIKVFRAQILSEKKQVVCELEKKVYIRLKPEFRPKTS